ncbi:MAG: hypothetical protein KDK78_01815, partial [Chlamydiia bacterium]|nr:hypothetical protein [Chlamydiia bacterium]
VSRVDEQFPLVELQDDEAADFPPGQRLALEMHLSQVAWEFNQGKEQASLLFPETEGWPPSTTSRCVGILRRAGYPYAARDPERPKEQIVVWKEEPPKAEEPKTE